MIVPYPTRAEAAKRAAGSLFAPKLFSARPARWCAGCSDWRVTGRCTTLHEHDRRTRVANATGGTRRTVASGPQALPRAARQVRRLLLQALGQRLRATMQQQAAEIRALHRTRLIVPSSNTSTARQPCGFCRIT